MSQLREREEPLKPEITKPKKLKIKIIEPDTTSGFDSSRAAEIPLVEESVYKFVQTPVGIASKLKAVTKVPPRPLIPKLKKKKKHPKRIKKVVDVNDPSFSARIVLLLEQLVEDNPKSFVLVDSEHEKKIMTSRAWHKGWFIKSKRLLSGQYQCWRLSYKRRHDSYDFKERSDALEPGNSTYFKTKTEASKFHKYLSNTGWMSEMRTVKSETATGAETVRSFQVTKIKRYPFGHPNFKRIVLEKPTPPKKQKEICKKLASGT